MLYTHGVHNKCINPPSKIHKVYELIILCQVYLKVIDCPDLFL